MAADESPCPLVTVLFARRDSIYKSMAGCDVWDADRDALNWPGDSPVVAHPPCRAWGRLRNFARPRPGERELALWAVDQIRQFGGVLEHPASSLLWKEKPLPALGTVDPWGGYTLPVCQWWWGHRAEKATWLYICGIEPKALPPIPLRFGEPTHVITQGLKKGDIGWRPRVTDWEREATPSDFARWLVEVARLTLPPPQIDTRPSPCPPMRKTKPTPMISSCSASPRKPASVASLSAANRMESSPPCIHATPAPRTSSPASA